MSRAAANAAQRRYYHANRTLIQERRRTQAYGISPCGITRLRIEQTDLCAICGKAEKHRRGDMVLQLSVDHDHATGRVRGLLCNTCNRAIGLLSDSPALLRRAAAYAEGLG